jgi:hypothetical protein
MTAATQSRWNAHGATIPPSREPVKAETHAEHALSGNERNWEIVRLHLSEGLTLSEIGRRFDITRERVRQIVKAHGAPSLTRSRSKSRTEARRIFRAVGICARLKHNRRHGTRYSYVHHRCSCEACREAARLYQSSLRGSPAPSHGLSGYVNYACRCAVCKRAKLTHDRENAKRRSVYRAVQNALRSGGLVKPERCEDCGAEGDVHGHHEDYAKPLEVDWLCRGCHGHRHAPHRATVAT